MKISVNVKPNAKQERLEKIAEDNFLVWVKERPQDGKANQAATKILAEYFGVAKSQVILLRGQTSRHKIFEVKRYDT